MALSKKAKTITLDCFCSEIDSCQPMGEGIALGGYEYNDLKTMDDKSFNISEIEVINANEDQLNDGIVIGQAVCFARDLGNRPGNVATPTHLANAAKDISKVGDIDLKIFDREEFTEMGMGGLAGVAQGTDEPPKFIILEYNNGGDKKPKVLVGKGLTFDSGGISIKPAAKMDQMKYDMCGSAVVLGVFHALSKLKPEVNVVGIIPSTENLSGSRAVKPGDVLTAYNGKTIEVLNTDAEGRLVLADALWYTQEQYKPELMVDLATLTGAIIVALGDEYAGLFSNSDKVSKQLSVAGNIEGEKLWRLPLNDRYDKMLNSPIADMQNITNGRGPGSITAAQFLQRFVNKVPWAHLDIAGTTWTKQPLPTSPKGATAFGVKLLNRFVSKYYEGK